MKSRLRVSIRCLQSLRDVGMFRVGAVRHGSFPTFVEKPEYPPRHWFGV